MDTTLTPLERAEILLKQLSLDEKMAQVTGVFPFDKDAQDFEAICSRTKYGIGTVSTLEVRRIETLEEAAAWQRRVQQIVMDNNPHHIPAAFHMEGLCGAFIQDAVSFPAGIGRGAGFDPELEKEIAKIVSRQELAFGATQILAPVLDVAYDPRMGRFGESYGEDPTLCAAMGTAYTEGIQQSEQAGRRAESIAKHFLGFHTSAGGIHGTYETVTDRTLREVYGKPFQAAIKKAKLKGIMPCYDPINGESPSASRTMLQGLLRDEMGFEGICFGDYGAVGQTHSTLHMEESMGDAGYRCMKAGMDLETPDPCGFSDELKAMFLDGRADIAILDRAVLRILESKFRQGLFEHPMALMGEELQTFFLQKEDQKVSLQAARESMVLLKNDGVLPIRNNVRRIAVIGPHADHPRKMFGGYTHLCMMESTFAVANSIAGVAGSENSSKETIKTVPGTNIQSDETPELDAILERQKPDCISLVTALERALPDVEITYAYGYPVAGSDESGFEEALAVAQESDLVILTLGGKHGTCSLATMGEGVDASNINLPPCQDAFIRKVSALQKPLAGVHFDGRPISSDVADDCLNVILEAWSPAEMGAQAVVEILTGKVNPSGKLPVTVARNAGQLPVIYNHPNGSSWHQSGSIGFANYVDLPHAPRYYFGYGLSYTSFEYSNLVIRHAESAEIDGLGHKDVSEEAGAKIAPTEAVEVSFTVKNTGQADGCEIVQMYLKDEYASMVRPVKELAGFVRVNLCAGESRRVTFRVEAGQTAFLDKDMRWKVEHGRILVEIGASSEDIRLSGEYQITGDAYIEGRERAFWSEVEL